MQSLEEQTHVSANVCKQYFNQLNFDYKQGLLSTIDNIVIKY